ncbi:hypothetical protein BDU57DRAFT_533313 [Ampelomyces quisqualis]|uniref:Uncharacterized protein n=1 Tax=Ampelomyces quisqualis TaxID=50730 RepID=A0A6A5Q822_AMPQU|nr:hypothetical protein BDU57DRAFT_533313 [Ampelomyces quisqualis]
MANEEQRRAFASYMGTAGTNGSQQATQQSGTYAGSGNPYLFQNQFPGVAQGLLPAAPTPPPAADSSVASYASYQGGAQGGYSGGLHAGFQGGFPQAAYQQNGFPQRPLPLGQETQHDQQPMAMTSSSVLPSGYGQVPMNYNGGPPPPMGNWQYGDSMAQQNGRMNDNTTARGAMVPSSRNHSGGIVESRSRQTSEQYHYHRHSQPEGPPAEVEEHVLVMLCHSCSVCGRMRSAGYHRNNPVIPGKPLVLTPCRRCKKKMKKEDLSMSSYTRIRSCTADDPCDWPRESVRIDIERKDHRGRQRSREEIYVYTRSPSRPRIIRQGSSQTRLGLGVLQQEQGRPRVLSHETRVRTSGLSPPRASRYDEIWPPPDVVPMKQPWPAEVLPTMPTNPTLTSREEVWPPPDVVPTHSYRKAATTPLRRQSSRIIELPPSPPPARTRSTDVVYRSESRERRPRSVSPVYVRKREERRSEDAKARLMSHPRAYRSVVPEGHNLSRTSDETVSTNDIYMTGALPVSPNRGILKPPSGAHETSHRERKMRASQQSAAVEVGGPRVHFDPRRRHEASPSRCRERPRQPASSRRPDEEYEHYHDYSRHRYVEDAPPALVEEMDRLRVRHSSPSQRSYEEEIRIDRARRISPSPPPQRYDDIRVRHLSPPPRARGRTPRPPPPPPEQPKNSTYRHVPRPTRTSPPPSHPNGRLGSEEDVTDSDSGTGQITEVRSWRGLDENGQPATFVEERKTTRMIEQGIEREFEPRGVRERERERVGARGWRDT